MSNFLKDKTAIVTGGSGTIGKAIAKALLTSGCNVFITGRNLQRLEAAVHDLKNNSSTTTASDYKNVKYDENNQHGKLHIFVGDICNETDVCKLFDIVVERYGGVDLLVNNAGTAIPGKTDELSVQDFERVMQVNVTGPFICAREAIRKMKVRGKGGRIINIGSISSQSPRPDGAPYTASKYALTGLSHSLSLDCRKYDIAVGIIHPGNVMSGLLTPEIIAEREEKEGFMEAEDVANCVLAMSSLPYRANVLEMTVIPTKQP
eukprot:CAMPEP_0176495374 /NCGR_PEP_ID=MMETSP0200_2-20121128/10617_1 /TAXON_ID=947934 /ORGANISM="Chaetoceros sp., Strain GSL56" /LENGTH=261 /DNA_ID=CAMNT_0017893237 /DNA_START=102 /DNA_END=884 /DNA_ORIENTATION=+